MGKINKPKKSSRLPTEASSVDHIPRPSVCFYHLDESVIALNRIDSSFFAQMIRQCKLLASMTWEEIYRHKGLGWDEVEEVNMKFRIPAGVKRDRLHHIKISKKGRMWGYREGNTFHVVWLDPNHEVTPER